jgi:sugar phosphate isomerase/epimerase
MHASDRYLKSGTLDDLRQSDGTLGYSPNLCHGVIGQGLIPYDRIFAILREVRFDGWISIEDGMNGLGEIAESARVLRRHMENQ